MSAREVEDALANLERLVQNGQRPSHYVARHVLLTLGKALRQESSETCAAWVARAGAAGSKAGEAWGTAVRDELTLACGEFAQCMDPRYLGLPNYDIEYTRAARGRLEDRLTAARALGFRPSDKETELLELADRVLEASLGRRGSRPPPEQGSRP